MPGGPLKPEDPVGSYLATKFSPVKVAHYNTHSYTIVGLSSVAYQAEYPVDPVKQPIKCINI